MLTHLIIFCRPNAPFFVFRFLSHLDCSPLSCLDLHRLSSSTPKRARYPLPVVSLALLTPRDLIVTPLNLHVLSRMPLRRLLQGILPCPVVPLFSNLRRRAAASCTVLLQDSIPTRPLCPCCLLPTADTHSPSVDTSDRASVHHPTYLTRFAPSPCDTR